MIQLAVKEIKKSFGIYPILDGLSFEIQDFDRVGIVGRNGCGKTTLFKMILGLEIPDEGHIFIRKEARIGYVEQIPEFKPEITVRDVLMMAFEELNYKGEELRKLEAQMADVEGKVLEQCLSKYALLSQAFEMAGGYEIEANINKIVTGFKMSEDFLKKPYNTLSGGEKTTVLLGKVLLQNPDILLLDEPTNHLDIQALEWLEEYLKQYKGAVVIISHDRYFLDKVVNKIIDIEEGVATVYKGNYSEYVKEKERILLEEFEAYEDQQKKIKAMEKAIKRLRDWANRADNKDLYKKAACIQKRLDKMTKLEKPVLSQKKMNLSFNDVGRSGKEVIEIIHLNKAFGKQVLFNELAFKMQYQERIALVGDNGCGKSTLIKMILGEEAVDQGEIKLGTRLKLAYLPQQVHFENEELTVLETFKKDVVMTETEARNTLAKFLFYGETVFKKIKGLSGGEKSRLQLCKLIQQDVNLLILDEPTNHLDIEARENLEEALLNFKGSLLFISHDRYFINKLAEKVNEIEACQITTYLGNYDVYREKKNEIKKREKAQEEKVQCREDTLIQPKQVIKEKQKNNKSFKKNNNINHKEKQLKKLIKLEEDIKAYELKIEVLDKEMNEIIIDYKKWEELEQEKKLLEQAMESLVEEWLVLQEN